MKVLAAAAALMVSGSAFAGATGNVAAVSDYLFRGVEQGLAGGAQIQGGLDYATDGGVYAGTWVSSLDANAYETDLYAGFAKNGFDVGYIFYGYRDATKYNFSEVYAGYSMSGFSVKGYYSPEYGNTEDEAFYVTGSYALALSDSLTLTPQVGYSFGDGIETYFGAGFDDYVDYSLTLAKTLEGGYTFSFGVVANSEDDTFGKETVLLGIKKAFDL
jgi:uncharacterized protein (TIGR02001 family)